MTMTLIEFAQEQMLNGNRPRRVYIAGPMRGLPNDNREAFFAVAKFIERLYRGLDLTITNPAEGDVQKNVVPETCSVTEFQGYLREDLTSLITCNEIVMLPGWESSEGASCEFVVARALGLRVSLATLCRDSIGALYCPHTRSLPCNMPSKWTLKDWSYMDSLQEDPSLSPVELWCKSEFRKIAREKELAQGKDTPKNVAEEAIGLVTKARNANYGPPKEDFERTAQIVHALIGVHMTASDIAKVMIAVKLSRETHKHKRDNLVDIIGYVLCMAEFYEDSKALKPGEALEATEGSRS